MKDIKKAVNKWQKRLGLSDWEITVGYSTQDHLDGQAMTRIYETSQVAKIFILSPDDRQRSDPNDSNIELDIVHELIHVRLWAIDPKDADRLTHALREQAIEWIAKALINN